MTETITSIRLEDVDPNPMHYRDVDPANVKTLAANIAAAGQIEPIRVWKDGDRYVIDAGHHRVAAMKQLGIEYVEAIIDDGERVEAMVASNMHFAESELERSRGTQLLLATGVAPVKAAAMIGVDQDKVSRAFRGMTVVGDQVACEDLTLDRLAAIADFEDDSEAVEKLECAPEASWRSVLYDLERNRTREQNIVEAEAIIKEAGCELLPASQIGAPDMAFYARQTLSKAFPPDGATAARVQSSGYSGIVDIVWYGPAEAEDAEKLAAQNAAREQEALIESELEKAAERRVEFIVGYLKGDRGSVSNALRDLAVELWEKDFVAQSANLTDTPAEQVTGFLSRIYASILMGVEAEAATLLPRLDIPYYVNQGGAQTIGYMDALEACGLTRTDVEAGVYEELVELLAGDE